MTAIFSCLRPCRRAARPSLISSEPWCIWWLVIPARWASWLLTAALLFFHEVIGGEPGVKKKTSPIILSSESAESHLHFDLSHGRGWNHPYVPGLSNSWLRGDTCGQVSQRPRGVQNRPSRRQTSVKRMLNSRQCVSRSSLDNPPVLFVLIIFQVNLLLKEVCVVRVSRNVFKKYSKCIRFSSL